MIHTEIHHFYDRDRHGDDIHSVVYTVAMRGRYKAYLVKGPGEDLAVRGYGDTELAAIADLNRELERAQ